MPASRQTPWLLCYDIADPDRLRQVHKEVQRYAMPFQYSVFRVHATRREVMERIRLLEHTIDPRSDDIRAYPLLTASAPVVYGRRLLAAGVHFGVQPEIFDKSHEEAIDRWS